MASPPAAVGCVAREAEFFPVSVQSVCICSQEEFLQIQACDLTCNNASREGIETCLRTLVGDGGPGNRHDSEEDRLLVECCVMSYHKLLGE